ncbi:MAG: 3'-5' exonuclease [Lentisphaerae bacterium]|nr:3'-5' exonuclease [Lentisphaerota bacterium]
MSIEFRILNVEHRRRAAAADRLTHHSPRVRCSMFVPCFLLLLLISTRSISAGPLPEGLRQTTFVAFDTETTGLSAARDRVIEIGAVRLRNGKIIERRVWLINPERPIPPVTTKIHGITDEDVAAAPLFKAVYPEFAAFVAGSIIVAHNAPFDVRFMANEVERNALPAIPEPVLDSLRLVRLWYPGLESYALKPVADHLKIKPGRYHRALDDSEALAQVFTAGLKQLPLDTTVSNLLETAGEALYIKSSVPLDGAATEPAR